MKTAATLWIRHCHQRLKPTVRFSRNIFFVKKVIFPQTNHGAVGALCFAGAPLAFLCIGRLAPCLPTVSVSDAAAATATTAKSIRQLSSAATASPEAAASACIIARASLIDLVLLGVGSLLFATGFILMNACVSPVLVQSASSRHTGRVVGLGAMSTPPQRARSRHSRTAPS